MIQMGIGYLRIQYNIIQYNIRVMIIQKQQDLEDLARDQEEVVKEIQQFRRINACLKKKIQARDKRINTIFSQIDHSSKSTIHQSPEPTIKKITSEADSRSFSKRPPQSEMRNKGKQNASSSNYKYKCNQLSLFKDHSSAVNRPHFKLPALDRKTIFAEDPESLENQPRTIKISLEKLVAIKPDEMKKKFERKYRGPKELVE